jgi:hypothetical protein
MADPAFKASIATITAPTANTNLMRFITQPPLCVTATPCGLLLRRDYPQGGALGMGNSSHPGMGVCPTLFLGCPALFQARNCLQSP